MSSDGERDAASSVKQLVRYLRKSHVVSRSLVGARTEEEAYTFCVPAHRRAVERAANELQESGRSSTQSCMVFVPPRRPARSHAKHWTSVLSGRRRELEQVGETDKPLAPHSAVHASGVRSHHILVACRWRRYPSEEHFEPRVVPDSRSVINFLVLKRQKMTRKGCEIRLSGQHNVTRHSCRTKGFAKEEQEREG